jgi:cell division protein FtsB
MHMPHSAAKRRRSQAEMLPALMRVMWLLIVAAGLLTLGFTFYPEWSRLADMKHDLSVQQTKLTELKKQCSDRELEVKLLQTDRQYLEMIARDRLDLMKEGETIFRLASSQHKS